MLRSVQFKQWHKRLSEWIQFSYCKKRGINKDTVAEVVKEALRVHA